MESQDPISIQNQDQNPDSAKNVTPATSECAAKPEQKLSAADIILQKLQAANQEPLEQIVQEASKEEVSAPAAEPEEYTAADGDNAKASASADYITYTKEQLVAAMEEIVAKDDVLEHRGDIDSIRAVFYKQHRALVAEAKRIFVEAGNNEEDFKPEPDAAEARLQELYDLYREKRNKHTEEVEKQKEENLAKKKEIINKIENLINSQETLNQTFDEFKNLQKQWREIGLVPQSDVQKLWESYNFQVERFYEFVKINKELRDLDLKKNTEQKIALCEKAEELLIESNVLKAFNELQKLHEMWKEVGPVAPANKEELWQRFKTATDTINRRHLDYYANIKKEQESNFKAKSLICEKVEEIVAADYTSRKEWDAKYKEILELQKMWKLIGFAPKKHNNAVYERFRNACDKFFDKKRDFYAQDKEQSDNNLQMKEDLCIQAEGLKDSTDWKKTAEILKNLQAKWKTIGPVPKKKSDEIWNRFRAACNAFFDNKNNYYKNIDKEREDNLKLKEELIAEVENFKFKDSDEQNISALKDLQKRWAQIGPVPSSKKDSIYERFRKAIDAQFAKINIDEAKRNEVRVKNLIDTMKGNPQAFEKLRAERERLKNRLDTLTQQISLSENNLGFFAQSKAAYNMIEGFKKKMEKSKNEAEALQKLISMLNKAINELPKKGEKK
ncbi:MAG: DUF349 domain-containing protein [Bacteroidales bacterium]|nr:DUF349 domain-containing protein [Bacteroidales bacterium]